MSAVLSIAVLAFVTITNVFGTDRSARHLTFGLLGILSVVLINVTRLSLIGLFPSYFSIWPGWVVHDLRAPQSRGHGRAC